MRIESFPRGVFLEIEPLLYKLYGLNKIWLDNAIHFAKDKLLYDPDEESKVDSDNYIYLPMPHKWYGSRFDEFCKKYSIDNDPLVTKVLSFIYMFFPIDDPFMTENNNYWEYVTLVRPEMLKLYKALNNGKTKYTNCCKITIGDNKPIAIDKEIPWFQMALGRYLHEYLGVENVKEAELELLNVYGGKYGRKQHTEEVRLIWGTYHLLQMSDQFKSDPDQLVTNLQCRLISDLLILFEWLEPTEDDGQKIKQRIHHYLKNFDSLDELITATQYKQSPNKKSSMDYY
jgi:hypothetical protein